MRPAHGNIQGGLKKAPEPHLGRVQHITRLLDEPVPDVPIYGHFPEAKVQVVDIVAKPRHESMDMDFILIVPVCVGQEC